MAVKKKSVKIVTVKPRDGEKVFEASFKKKKSGKLLWVTGSFKTQKDATEGLISFVQRNHENEGYRLYGGPMEKK